MSMLAERKIKQKWSLNPRGKAWSDDSSKFGQKMLEKMGWSKGKGLGAKENGIVEHVKISYKNDSKGMGFKETNDQWTEHDSNFNALLQSLSGTKSAETEVKISSLEQKSQSSKVRVHYKKFTRGKDLSRCTEKDLANIFGKKSLKESKNEQKPEETETETKDSFTQNGGSMVDYFKKKLPNYGKNNGYAVGSNGVLKKESESEEETFIGFGFKTEKKRKSSGDVSNGTPKKLKKEENEEEGIKGLNNLAFDPLFGNVEVQKHVLNTIEEEISDDEGEKKRIKKESIEEVVVDSTNSPSVTFEVKKKKKKKHSLEAIENPIFSENNSITNSFEVKRKKKKKHQIEAIDNPNFDLNLESDQSGISNGFEVKRKKKKNEIDVNTKVDDNSCLNNVFEVKRKKKKKTEENKDSFAVDSPSSLAIDNPNFDVNSELDQSGLSNGFEVKRKKKKSDLDDHSCLSNGFEVKRKKKKKKKMAEDKDSFAIDNPNFDINSDSQNSHLGNDFEVKRSTKKKKLAIDNPNFNSSNEDSQSGYVNSEFEVKRKKKTKDPVAIDNPNFNNSSLEETEPTFDLILNVTSTPTVVAPTPTRSSIKRRKSVRFSDVNEEHIIPNKEDLEERNELFDINSRVIANGLKDTNIEENIEQMSKKIDGFQAEIENDMNEAKAMRYLGTNGKKKKSPKRFIGEVGNPDGENEKLPNGTKLKFKYASFGRTPSYMNKNKSGSKSSYKHLIKGDIVLGFNNTNLHEIVGYGVKKNDS